MLEPLEQLVAASPAASQAFPNTEYPLPVQVALYGHVPSTESLVASICGAEDVVATLEPGLALAEAIESVAPDRLEFFQTDAQTRALVFTGVKWRAGWIMLVGQDIPEDLIRELTKREFLVFCTDAPADAAQRTVRIPDRPTGVVYFLQLAVRYGMIWGRIPPGDSHELGHFLEDDVPGVVVAYGPLRPLESFLVLGLMKLGIPAIVPSGFPYPQGRQFTADSPEEILEQIGRLPNLRVKEVDGRQVQLPSYADPAHGGDSFEPACRLGGHNSFLFAQHDPGIRDGDVIVGQLPTGAGDFGIVIGLASEKASDSVCELMEEKAAAALKSLKGVRPAQVKQGTAPFGIDLSSGTAVEPARLAEVIRCSLQFQYPRLGPVSVRVTSDPAELSEMAPVIRQRQRDRRDRIAALPGKGIDPIYTCTDCQPFSREHVCVVTPVRKPMCGRDWREIEAGALFGVGYFPYKRRADEARPNEQAVDPGKCLDEQKGEYTGINQAVYELSHNTVERVFLHSVRDFPHTSCGCFRFLAFWIEEVGGVGVMHRGYTGEAPNGDTWDTLANKAGGKQSPGVVGVGPGYVGSASFLSGDGGYANIVWMSQKAKEVAGPSASHVPTEQEVSTIDELIAYLGKAQR